MLVRSPIEGLDVAGTCSKLDVEKVLECEGEEMRMDGVDGGVILLQEYCGVVKR